MGQIKGREIIKTVGHAHYTVDWDTVDLKKLYWDDGLFLKEIGEKFGVSSGAVRNAMARRSIERRDKSERGIHYKRRFGKARNVTKECIKRGGYIAVYKPNHPRAKRNYVLEHILVWETHHQRPLPEGWVIHHINGIKSDNRPSNLKALPSSKHNALISVLKRKIRQLEIENQQLNRALQDGQMIFYISEN